MFLRILVVACFAISVAQAQDIQYVFAENGLVVREKPNQGAIKVGLLDYGTPVEVLEHTNLRLDIKDSNQKISGEWVKIRGLNEYEHFEEGYVFNGFLTEKKIQRPLKVKFDAFTVFVDELKRNAKVSKASDDEITLFSVTEGATPENRYIKIKHHQNYRTIQVFQRHQNSLVLNLKDSNCELSDFKRYNSSWKPLKMLSGSKNIFKTKTVSQESRKRFGDINLNELKAFVAEQCDEKRSESIIASFTNNKGVSVRLNQVQLRIVMTDIDGYKTEKIISFELPFSS